MKKMHLKRILSISVCLCLLFCSVPNINGTAYAASKTKLNKTKVSLYIGKSFKLKVLGSRKKVSWSSSNKKIASVTKAGKVTAKKKGTTTIKAKLGKKVYKCKVKVKNKKNAIKYDADLVKKELSKETDYDVDTNGDGLTVNISSDKNTKDIKDGDVIMLPSNEEFEGGLALKVNDIKDSGEELAIEGTVPEMDEIFDQINISKTVPTEFNEMKVNTKYVQSIETNNKKYISSSVKIGKDIKLNLIDKDLGSNGHLDGSIEIKAPEITADIDAKFSGLKPTIKRLNIDVENKAIAKVNVDVHSSVKPIYLASINSVALGNGFFVDVVFYLCIDANGNATVQCTITNNAGINYSSSKKISPYCDFKKSFEGTQAEIDAKLLLNPEVKIRWGGYWSKKEHEAKFAVQIIGVELDFGPGLYAKTEVHDSKPFICTNLDIYAYLDLGLVTDDGLGKLLKKLDIKTNWVLLDKDSKKSINVNYHFEDGKKVTKCTYKKSSKDLIDDEIKTDICGDAFDYLGLTFSEIEEKYGLLERYSGAEGGIAYKTSDNRILIFTWFSEEEWHDDEICVAYKGTIDEIFNMNPNSSIKDLACALHKSFDFSDVSFDYLYPHYQYGYVFWDNIIIDGKEYKISIICDTEYDVLEVEIISARD